MDILHSFLCGAAFLGGATCVLVLVGYLLAIKDKNSMSEKLHGYWKSSIENHEKQLAVLERIADVLAEREKHK